MPSEPLDPTLVANLASWNINLEAAICEHCDWSYLLPAGVLPVYCPHCFEAPLSSLAGQADSLSYSQPPELILPFTVSNEKLAQNIQHFAGGIWFAPGDLNPQNLKERLQRIYLPMWLVDSDVEATWQAEAGFNYDVVSHQDRFDENRGGWVSQQITETRIRWEPRLGRLRRIYHNTIAPALEEHIQFQRKLGQYNLKAARPYQFPHSSSIVSPGVYLLPLLSGRRFIYDRRRLDQTELEGNKTGENRLPCLGSSCRKVLPTPLYEVCGEDRWG